MNTAAGTVDTGSALILRISGTPFYGMRVLYSRVNNLKHPLFADAFDRFRRAICAVVESITKLLRITLEQYANLKPLFSIGDRTFQLTANAQI
jgi:hypothetical protein